MGKLIDPDRTRRAKKAREDRAKKILDAAHTAFTKFPYSEVSLDSVGKLAGVKQGQASLAFRSLEELFLTVVRSHLNGWYDSLEARLGESDDVMSADQIADLVAATLAERPDLTRVLGPLHMALEQHEDGMEVFTFYSWQRQRLLSLAESMIGRLVGAHTRDCFDALYRSQLIAAAIDPVSRPVGNLAMELVVEDHRVFALDLEDEIRRVVLGCLVG
jgi:AcrR family transcriptional regulator